MLHFENDYNRGIHPQLLQTLVDSNQGSFTGYGIDSYCIQATEKIKEACHCPEAEIFFLSGGTQTNQVVIDSLLTSYEGVIAAETGHASIHEAGAIESTGHKVLTLSSHQGKIQAAEFIAYVDNFYHDGNHDHMVFPGVIYISHPAEYGTLYTKEELTAISDVCRQYQLPLFIDGARLRYGLAAKETEVSLPTIAALSDVFYIGGTRMGAFIGEAVVLAEQNTPKRLVMTVKQHGALLAKGWLIGAQFDRFFTDNLYSEIGEHATKMAEQLKDILREKGHRFYLESPTNQQFIIIEDARLATLGEVLAYSFWEKCDDTHTVIHLATSWSTTQEDIDKLREVL